MDYHTRLDRNFTDWQTGLGLGRTGRCENGSIRLGNLGPDWASHWAWDGRMGLPDERPVQWDGQPQSGP